MNVLFWDLQTTEWIDKKVPFHQMDIACVATHLMDYHSHQSAEIGMDADEAIALLPEQFDLADAIIGYNVMSFDYQVIKRHFSSQQVGDWQYKTIDLMELCRYELGRRPGLNTLYKYTLGQEKLMHGKEAVRLWQKGERDSVKSYCANDVALLRKLFEFGCVHGVIRTYNWDLQDMQDIDTKSWMWYLAQRNHRLKDGQTGFYIPNVAPVH